MENRIEEKLIENQDDNIIEKPQSTEVKQEKISEEEFKNAKKGFWKTILVAIVVCAIIVLFEELGWDLIVMTVVAVVVGLIFLISRIIK